MSEQVIWEEAVTDQACEAFLAACDRFQAMLSRMADFWWFRG